MKKIFGLLSVFAVLSVNAQFIPGNLAVVQIGNGVETLAGTGNSLFIDQYTPLGIFVNAVTIPNSGGSSLVMGGNRTAEGYLSLSADRLTLGFAAYRSTPGAVDIQAATAAAVPRAFGMVDMAGNFSIPVISTTAYSTLSWRSAVTDGSGNYWGFGGGNAANGGVYLGLGTPTNLQSTLVTLRSASIFNGNLYFANSGSAGAGTGIYGYVGLPTAPATPTQLISTGANAAPNEFAINAAGNLAYIADDRSVATGGGIQKWTFNGSTWSSNYTILSGSPNGARGLAVDFSGVNPVIYATTGESTAGTANKIVQYIDTGVAGTAIVLATSGPATIFRGLELIPVPEPSAFVLAGIGAAVLLIFRRRK